MRHLLFWFRCGAVGAGAHSTRRRRSKPRSSGSCRSRLWHRQRVGQPERNLRSGRRHPRVVHAKAAGLLPSRHPEFQVSRSSGPANWLYPRG